MNKNTKTALIVALSIFGAGVLIWLCVSLSVGFNYSKLTVRSDSKTLGAEADSNFKKEHIDKDFDENGQKLVFNLSSADIVVEPSSDGKIHLSYDNTEETRFELDEAKNAITLTQRSKNDSFFGFVSLGSSEKLSVRLSLPADREGKLDIGSASGDVSISDISEKADMRLSSISGDVNAKHCAAETFGASTTSGELEVTSIEANSVDLNSVSGGIKVSEIGRSTPVSIASTSGEVYAENIEANDFTVSTISGEVSLTDVSGQKAGISTTSGAVTLSKADFRELKYTTISGDIRGTVSGSAEDYTVYADTVSGGNSLSGNRERGERTLDLNSTSGSFDIRFEK